MKLNQGMLNSRVEYNYNSWMLLENINILGVENEPNIMKINDESIDFEYISLSKRVKIGGINGVDLGKWLSVSWI